MLDEPEALANLYAEPLSATTAVIIAAIIGALSAIVASRLTQRWSAKAEAARWRRDQLLQACQEFISAAREISYQGLHRELTEEEVFAFLRLETSVDLLGTDPLRSSAKAIMVAVRFENAITPKPLDSAMRETFSKKVEELTQKLTAEYRKMLGSR